MTFPTAATTAAEAAYIKANAEAEEAYNAARSRAYAAYAAVLADAPGRYESYVAAYAVLMDSVEDAEIARDAALDTNHSIYLASRAAADAIWPGAVAESTP